MPTKLTNCILIFVLKKITAWIQKKHQRGTWPWNANINSSVFLVICNLVYLSYFENCLHIEANSSTKGPVLQNKCLILWVKQLLVLQVCAQGCVAHTGKAALQRSQTGSSPQCPTNAGQELRMASVHGMRPRAFAAGQEEQGAISQLQSLLQSTTA